ncbi:MAG TPA: ATP-binding cassette domain-containing protein [Holophagaceae bacterium]|jgi:ABC-type transporter Mla maintaining outer membrane lipid asymmetry ATPase subunit MlaF|nr:ATP-binding cassette domain-containing protein [Holophagaceae bacterium]
MAEGLVASDLALAAPDGRVILRNASLEVPAGGRVWIEGPPGSGKRALLKVIAGLLPPERGEVRLGGFRLWPGEGAMALRGRLRTGFAFAQGGLLSNQTLRENLAMPLRFAGRGTEDVEGVLDRLGLAEAAGLRPHALGARARKLAQFARIELLQPEVVFLSEPFEGLEGPDVALAERLIQGWAVDPDRLIMAAAEVTGAGVLPRARHLRLEAGRIQPIEGAP